MELTGKQKRYLRGLGHRLRATVQIGRHGVTPAVVDGTAAALAAHELVKVRFGKGFDDSVDEAADTLARRTGSAVASRVGGTVLLFRARSDDPVIRLPDAAGEDRPA